MDELQVRFVGTSPLLMHNRRLSNPLDNFARSIKALTTKRKKTDEDHQEIAWLEFQGGMYFDAEIGPYVPGENIDAAIVEGAKMLKKGTDVKRSVTTLEDKVKLVYPGPKDLKAMYEGGFADIRRVSSQGLRKGSSIMRCRPIFSEWSVSFTLAFDPTQMNHDDLVACLVSAGKYTGICDARPRYGKFDVETK